VSTSEAQVVKPRGRLAAFELVVVLPTLAALAFLLVRRPHDLKAGLVLWMAMIVAIDLLPVPAWHGLQLLMDFPLLIAVAILYPPAAAGFAVFIASFDPREFRREVGPLRALFNRSQVAASALAAGAVFHAIGDEGSAIPALIGAAFAAIVTAYAVNAGLVTAGASILYDLPVSRILKELRIGRPAEFLVSYLGLGGVGVVCAELYLQVGMWAVVAVVALLLLSRQLFFRTLALEKAHQELASAYAAERRRVKDLEDLDREKAQFSKILSHDFMHAIAMLRTYAVALSTRWTDLDEAKRLEVVRWIERESDRLRALAQQSVVMMELEADTVSLSLRPEHVVELVREAADSVDELGGRLKVDVHADVEGAVLMSDRVRVLQVLTNLLRNAEKYSDPATPIGLAVARQGEDIVFTVTDEGHGIAPGDVGRLFQRFSRLSTPETEGIPGSGLGLYICRRIADAHGGRIWVESELTKGSTFSFALPVDGPGQPGAELQDSH
jgi:signal transduction histidine kinase